MNCLRSQFELRFTPILGFEQSIAKLTAPIQKIGAELLYNEINSGKYVLVFNSEAYIIDIRNDRMVFVSSKSLDTFTNTSGPFFHFLNTFEKLKLMDGYIGLSHSLLAEWYVHTNSKTFEQNMEEFRSTYFNNEVNKSFKGIEDINISIESKADGYNTKYTFGPFNNNTDVEKHNLKFILNNSETFDYNGLLSQSVITSNNTEVDINIVRGMISTSKNIRKLITI